MPYRDESAAALTQLLAAAAAAQAAADQHKAAAAAAACEESPYSSMGESEGSDSYFASDEGEQEEGEEEVEGEEAEEDWEGDARDSTDGRRDEWRAGVLPSPAPGHESGKPAVLVPQASAGPGAGAASVAWRETRGDEAGAGTALAGTSPGPPGSSLPACSGSSSSAVDGGSQQDATRGATAATGTARGRSTGGGDSASHGPASRAPQLPPRPSGSRPSRTSQPRPGPGQEQQQHKQQSSASVHTERQLKSSHQLAQQQATSAAPQHPKQVAVLALCPAPDGEPPLLTAGDVDELRRVTPEQFRQLWKHICMQVNARVRVCLCLRKAWVC